MDLKRVTKIQQRYKDIVNGFVKKSQNLLPSDNAYYNIVDFIKHIILSYYHLIFESNLVNDDQKIKFLKLLEDNNIKKL